MHVVRTRGPLGAVTTSSQRRGQAAPRWGKTLHISAYCAGGGGANQAFGPLFFRGSYWPHGGVTTKAALMASNFPH